MISQKHVCTRDISWFQNHLYNLSDILTSRNIDVTRLKGRDRPQIDRSDSIDRSTGAHAVTAYQPGISYWRWRDASREDVVGQRSARYQSKGGRKLGKRRRERRRLMWRTLEGVTGRMSGSPSPTIPQYLRRGPPRHNDRPAAISPAT